MINIYDYIKKQVDFEIIYTDNNKQQYAFNCEIFDILPDKIKVTTPVSNDYNFDIVQPGQKLEANFYTDNGVLSAEMNYLMPDTDSLIYTYLSFPYNNHFSQRRERKRIPMHLDCELNILNSGSGVLNTKFIKTKNISAKGIACLTDEPIEDFENARLLIHFQDEVDITVFCRKVYTKEIKLDNKILYLNGICFTDISKNDIRTIIKNCIKYEFDSQHSERVFEEL